MTEEKSLDDSLPEEMESTGGNHLYLLGWDLTNLARSRVASSAEAKRGGRV